MTSSVGHHDNHSTSTQYVFHEAISTRSSLPDVEDSESELSFSRPDDESCVTSQTNNDVSEKYSIDDVTNKKVINRSSDTIVNERALRRSNAIELNNLQDCVLVSFETREGKAKRNKHFISSAGTLVRCQNLLSNNIQQPKVLFLKSVFQCSY